MKLLKSMVILFAGTLLALSARAQGVFAGSKEHPVPVAYGQIQKIAEQGPPLKLEATKLQVKLSDIYYEAVADSRGLFKPTLGEAQTVTIGDFKVELASKDFSKGFLDTKDFGKVALFVFPSMTGPDRWILAATEEQLKKFKASFSAGADQPAIRSPQKNGKDLDRQDSDGVTALMRAAENGQLSIVKDLISKGANVHLKDKVHGMTALMVAAGEGHLEIVQCLIEAGAEIDGKDKTLGASPLMVASRYGYLPIVKLLISEGADVNGKSRNGYSPLAFACLDGRLQVVKELLQADADVNCRDERSITPLMVAAFKGYLEIVKVLVASGADVDATSSSGLTAREGAQRQGHLEVARYLETSADTTRARTSAPLVVDPESRKNEGAAFLAANAKKEGVTTTSSGLQYKVLKSGSGPSPKLTNRVRVHYHGTLIDGTVFDSTVQRGVPATFSVKALIPGWTEALQLMKVGDKWQLFIPPDLAYGEKGGGSSIGPNSTLLFELELLRIEE